LKIASFLTFVQFAPFTTEWARLGLGDDDLRALECEILKAPSRAPLIKGTGGLRKIRFADRGSGRGKSGAYRVCYAHFPEYGLIALVVVFGKNERDDLTAADRKTIARVIVAFHDELRRKFARRRQRWREEQ
jgi:hypothetical protein